MHETVVGDRGEQLDDRLRKRNYALTKSLSKAKSSEKMIFIGPGEQERAYARIQKELFSEADELWLFDSYFTDRNHGNLQMLDWLRLITHADTGEKHIVFYSRDEEHAYTADGLRQLALSDPIIAEAIREKKQKLELIQTDEAIHDRFLILKKEELYHGLSIGTSLNSLEHNFYMITQMEHAEAKSVVDRMASWLQDHIHAREVCAHEI